MSVVTISSATAAVADPRSASSSGRSTPWRIFPGGPRVLCINSLALLSTVPAGSFLLTVYSQRSNGPVVLRGQTTRSLQNTDRNLTQVCRPLSHCIPSNRSRSSPEPSQISYFIPSFRWPQTTHPSSSASNSGAFYMSGSFPQNPTVSSVHISNVCSSSSRLVLKIFTLFFFPQHLSYYLIPHVDPIPPPKFRCLHRSKLQDFPAGASMNHFSMAPLKRYPWSATIANIGLIPLRSLVNIHPISRFSTVLTVIPSNPFPCFPSSASATV
mmetsp:Transcript_61951/g.183019  ORF Transcript_61951/g.183019 Transcript_61951/m.183019 type:complete len:269 (-) Transcript_61951:1556-2362(-)